MHSGFHGEKTTQASLAPLMWALGRARIGRMEPTEMQEFSKQMKEGGEESLTKISLAISILAVLVAMVMVLGHRSHTEAVLMQSRAGDQWNGNNRLDKSR